MRHANHSNDASRPNLMWAACLVPLLLLGMMGVSSSACAQRAPLLTDPPAQAAPISQGATHRDTTAAAPAEAPTLVPVLSAAQPRVARAAAIASERATGDDLGRATRALFALQASNEAAGPDLPMLGNEVTVAYKRYLDSFALPVPQYFEQRVKSGNSGS